MKSFFECICCQLGKLASMFCQRCTLVIPAIMVSYALINEDCIIGFAGLALGAILVELQEIKKMIRNCCWY